MSWKATAMVKKLTHALDGTPIPRDAKLVYLILADYHNTAERAAWPSVAELARESLMSPRHAYRQLDWLETHGEIRREGIRGGFGRRTSYRFPRIDGEGEGENGDHGTPYGHSGKVTAPSPSQKNLSAQNGDRTLTVVARNSDRTVTSLSPTIRNTGEPVRTEPVEHHAFGSAIRVWLAIKDELKTRLEPGEWKLWVRPCLLTRVIGDRVFLVSLPPSNRIIEAAQKRRELVQDLARPHGIEGIVFSRYPDLDELTKIRDLYPEQWNSFVPAVRRALDNQPRRAGGQPDAGPS
ncbi:MAG: helix-turn-helix domain-containing protein [Acidobacteriota bacterium]|nr:helix-turn-helix domain-containing protein [Acidobacteriota bacterium]